MGQKWAKPVRKPILDVRQFAGVELGIFFSAVGGVAHGSALEAA